jgi:hypothetical protein
MKIDLGLKDVEGVRNALTKLQWCCILWYSSYDNSVAVTTYPSLKACLYDAFDSIESNRKKYHKLSTGDEFTRNLKINLVQHVISGEDDSPFEYDGNDSVTILVLQNKIHWKQTAKELDYEC